MVVGAQTPVATNLYKTEASTAIVAAFDSVS